MNKVSKAAAAGLVVGIMVFGAPPSFANETSPDGGTAGIEPYVTCSPDGTDGPWFAFSDKASIYIPDPSTRVYGDAGVTLSILVGKSYTFSTSVTGTTGITVESLLVKANASLAIQTSKSRTSSLTQGGSWKVPGPGQGWLEVGTTDAYSFKWEKYKFNSPCTKVALATGTTKAPSKTASPYFKHS